MTSSFIIRQNDRIAQLMIVKTVRANFIKVDKLDETQRGTGGFGSTGGNAGAVKP